mmetsp:Transcript_4715/g.4417  ORF Transcript_4715/g.4417 Transcript_4715/m.4417 type:complete len:156 (-) Transcript_4715:299-766(-)
MTQITATKKLKSRRPKRSWTEEECTMKRNSTRNKQKKVTNFDFNAQLNALDNKGKDDVKAPALASQMKFIKVRVHTRLEPHRDPQKGAHGEKLIHLEGEIEISDKLKFRELFEKSAKLFNRQLDNQKIQLKISDNPVKSNFRFADSDGTPDINFP